MRSDTDEPRPDPDLVEFACLAHDLGHPPFGHAGEVELHKTLERQLASTPAAGHAQAILLDKRLELGGFEGNPQSFRLVTRLAHKWLPSDGAGSDLPPEWFGLDLTAAAMDAVTKYPWQRIDENQRKWGCYGNGDQSDRAALEWARDLTSADPALAPNATKCFEAQLMDWCDDVTYAVHDMEDFYQIGFIPLESLFSPEHTEVWLEFRDWLRAKWADSDQEASEDELDGARSRLADPVAHAVAVAGPFRGTNTERRLAHKRTSGLIKRFVEEIDFEGEPILHRGIFRVHSNPDRARELMIECNLLKELIWHYVIESPSLATQQAGHRRIVRDLVDLYCAEPNLLPTHYKEMLDAPEMSTGYADINLARLRVIADHVSSLTEQHAAALHRRLTGADPGGFRDLI
jgi:dGTPase